MPTEQLNRLEVRGSAADLAAFAADKALWSAPPWSDLFELRVERRGDDGLVYRFEEDWKRPAPSVAAMAAAHPRLVLVHEYCDEFAQGGARLRYADGRLTDETLVDPLELEWIEWVTDDP